MVEDFPRLGLGTWQNDDPEQCVASVRTALEMGYRHIDTAQTYGNEEYIGRGIADADVDRADVFLATKLGRGNLAYDDVLETAGESLERLGVDSLDLLYIHWPVETYDPGETLPAVDELYDDGLIDRIGISNFEPRHIEEAAARLDAPIFANQVEFHPLLPQEELRAAAAEHDHWIVGYSPLGHGATLSHPVIESVAEEVDGSPAQVCLAWSLSKERVGVIPKATGKDHIRENFDAIELALTDAQLERIDDIEERSREIDPEYGPWNE